MKRAFILIILISGYSYSQIFFSPTVNISSTPSTTSDYHSVYSEGSNFYVVWGDNGDIMFKSSTNSGLTWSSNSTVFSGSGIAGWPVVISALSKIFVFYHYLESGSYRVFFSYSTNNGLTWQGGGMVSTSLFSTAITPQVTFDGTRLHAAWEERVSNNKYQIFYSQSDETGLSWWLTPPNISGDISVDSRWCQLVYEDGVLYLAWLDSPSYPAHDIMFKRSTDNGWTWSPKVNLSNDVLPQTRITLKARGNSVYIASQDMVQINFDEVGFRKSTDKGLTWSDPVNLSNNSGGSGFPSFEVADEPNGDHRIYLTWFDNTLSAPNYDNSEIFFIYSTNSGSTFTDPVNLSNNHETSSRPRICLSRNPGHDTLFVIWYDYSLGAAEILGRRGTYDYIVPVELTSYYAETSGNTVNLFWNTSTEINNLEFRVYRYYESGEKEFTGSVPGNGSSTTPNSYSFTDRVNKTGKYFYELEQIDFDGTVKNYGKIEVSIEIPDGIVLYQNFPNPFSQNQYGGISKIQFYLPTESIAELILFNNSGEKVFSTGGLKYQEGFHEVIVDAGNLGLPSGVYFYRLISGNRVNTGKMLYLK
ncbi:MAG: exo-alpha-sialidase [Ignavibacteriaceae bacterium]|nr:exo-alpha-sialidase [Ignavibacteriaceae bacterium]